MASKMLRGSLELDAYEEQEYVSKPISIGFLSRGATNCMEAIASACLTSGLSPSPIPTHGDVVLDTGE